MVALLARSFASFIGQPTPVQAIVVIGVLALLYPPLVVARLLVTALYGAFRGLG
jgi:hypothetical protein